MPPLRALFAVATLGLVCAFSVPSAEPVAAGAAGYELKGRVTDAAGSPLAGVRVGFRAAGTATETDAVGGFVLRLPAGRPLTPDRTKVYEHVEVDGEGWLGQTVELRDLAMFDQPLEVKLAPPPVTEDRAEFTARLSLDITLPSISAPKDFSLIAEADWQKWLAGMDARTPAAQRTEQVVFQAYVPKAAARLKAAFLLTRHGIGSIDHPRLRAFADRNAVALVSVKGNPVQRGFYPVDVLDPYVARLGQMLKRPELVALPVITFGHSNGTGFSGIIASRRPGRTLAWISYHSGAAFHLQFPGVEQVPGLVMHGRIDPFFKNGQEATVKHLRRQRQAPLTFMLEANVAHGPADKDQNATWDFIAAYAEAALRTRLNADSTVKAVALEQGWLGAWYDGAKGGQQELAIAPYADYPGDRAAANWLPDETFAHVWQRYGMTDPRPKK